MVRLTVDLIARGTSGYTKKRTDESIQHFLKRLSHLYLENRNIDEVGDDLSACRNLMVLYLYDNQLSCIPNLNGNGNLTHLYLQNNDIQYIDNLSALRKLQKLYLGGNHITVIEGLEKLQMLQELHVEHQHLPPGEKLLFEPRTLATLSRSLQVLNVSGNGLDSIRDLACLSYLTQLSAADNSLGDMKEMSHLLSMCRHISKLDLMGNPLCHKNKYRDRIIVMAPALEMFDGKEVTELTKKFLLNWQANKEAMKRKREITRSSSHEMNSAQPSEGAGDFMPQHKGPMAQVPGYIMPGLPRKQFQDVLARSNSQPNSAQLGQRTHHNGVLNGHSQPELNPQGPRYRNTLGTPYHVYDRSRSGGEPKSDDMLVSNAARPKLLSISSAGFPLNNSRSLHS